MAEKDKKEPKNEQGAKEPGKLTLGAGKGTLSLKAPVATGNARQNVAVGRSAKPVAVEVKKRRGRDAEQSRHQDDTQHDLHLTDAEREARTRALQQAQHAPKDNTPATQYQTQVVVKSKPVEEEAAKPAEPAQPVITKSPAEQAREQELAKLRKINEQEEQDRRKRDADARKSAAASAQNTRTTTTATPASPADAQAAESRGQGRGKFDNHGRADDRAAPSIADEINKKRGALSRYGQQRRRSTAKMTVSQVLNDGFEDRDSKSPSLAAQRRARERMKMKMLSAQQSQSKQYREVIVPEVITVAELANRMTERVGDVVKKLMTMGIMATATQTIDADTAELIVHEFGHTLKRVSESDVESDILGIDDTEEQLQHRPPVVTIMGHVDHGKTSLLDAIRQADVAAHESGGITQHIGAYQITTGSGKKITFIDTPGHAAFTEMRARGADVTDIVVLVVAADDSVMPQTVEAISHAKAAGKPIIVAINKCDLPTANPKKVRTELLQYEVVTEDMGGDSQSVEVSAKAKKGLDALEEAILLQAEVLNLRANPDRIGLGAVIESRMEQGKGSVATVLVQNGTLKQGDVFVTGTEWGRVRALHNDRGQGVKLAIPGQPIEVLGLNGTPDAGDDFVVVTDEAKAREISEFRLRRKRALHAAKSKGRAIDQMIQDIQSGSAKSLPVIIKGDVHGSIEAIAGALNKLTEENTEVKVNVMHSGVGAITESDITLANASGALIIGFNVRANPQARDLAKRDGVEIRYYSIIYEVIDEVKALLSGLLSPAVKEKFIGYAEIRQVFNVTKYGKIAGCFVTEGMVKRGAKVRLLRDNVVIHEGTLKTLRRFKDEVKEVQKGYECGMAFDNYEDIKDGDMIEAFEIETS
ncbi:MAG: translation initiation factor IF-2, partial [Bdellovibrionales bacterium]|nr:translation initiation factor IF-2 [Bdellovibrionales bacterium]